ncbi:hypothetical protein D3C75_1195030 [compost metagenome]
MPLTSTLAGTGLRLSMVPTRPLSCWMAVAKLGVRDRSAKLAEPSLMSIWPMWIPSGLSLLAAVGFAWLLAGASAGCGISRSLMLVVRSSLMMKRA